MINKKELSKTLGYSDAQLRENRIPTKHSAAIQELNDLIEYWKKRNNL